MMPEPMQSGYELHWEASNMDKMDILLMLVWLHGIGGGFFFGWFAARSYFLKRVVKDEDK
jgi:hypothetical protein